MNKGFEKVQKYPNVFLRVMCGDGKEKLFEVEVAYGVAAREAASEGGDWRSE